MDGNTVTMIIELLGKRADGLIGMAKHGDNAGDAEFAQQMRDRAWELTCAMDAIERLHADTPSSKAA